MDFTDSPAVAAFRTECRAWLEANASPAHPTDGASIALLDPGLDDETVVARARAWQARAAADGWAGIGWPRAFGGRGASLVDQVVFAQEAAHFDVPDHVFRIGITMAGPTIIAHGTNEQRARWLPPMLTGEEIWCQLFSEPGAGSDLAALRTTAERDGDAWVVNGQKVWSSGAHYSRWGMLLARTDLDAPKHRGITYFGLDMDTPGVDIRPLRQMTGGSHFNEVFLTDVRVPDAHRIGEANGGWGVAQTTLLHERASVGDLLGEGRVARGLGALAHQAEVAGRRGAHDARVRQELAAIHTEEQILRYLMMRVVTAFALGRLPGPEASVAKLAMARLLNRAGAAALALDPEAALTGVGPWVELFLAAPAVRIAGGSDEIQRNIVGERVLGLPREPGPPPDTPFRDLPA